MRLFVQTLEGNVRKWFKGLTPTSIDSWTVLEITFMRQRGEKRDHLYYLTEFGILKKRPRESVIDYNKSFNKIYKKIPADIKPSQEIAKVAYVKSFEPHFAMMLRESRLTTLLIIQDVAIDIEGNMIFIEKINLEPE